ncbi:MAG: Fis family transcriptional regulator [Gammaproteobacteria bacterium]|jgi:Fis family transcriptional regulator, factor for inversion stimulation protein|nr:Fis family transcriptional regulator [Gammaproteobacteria bacterium]MBT4462572.1 Fis family transcriptional regulator [Gammaproteobacteria bacterium]MBT4654819.1 Fis family transcriptional regulator [Gammaproteobacteria bacterium]MBT5116796.1 Fis family transcriptional regulator [Gammaproteobacteria bacterium]MBT5761692.1 Fis family transcriptional regulator [Gammaproteobacteria bacterium]
MEKIKKIAVSSLSKTIKNETLAYINKMNGQGVSNLHSLFVTEVEKSLISAVLSHLGGNVTKTASYLGINRGTLIKRIKDYGISI